MEMIIIRIRCFKCRSKQFQGLLSPWQNTCEGGLRLRKVITKKSVQQSLVKHLKMVLISIPYSCYCNVILQDGLREHFYSVRQENSRDKFLFTELMQTWRENELLERLPVTDLT